MKQRTTNFDVSTWRGPVFIFKNLSYQWFGWWLATWNTVFLHVQVNARIKPYSEWLIWVGQIDISNASNKYKPSQPQAGNDTIARGEINIFCTTTVCFDPAEGFGWVHCCLSSVMVWLKNSLGVYQIECIDNAERLKIIILRFVQQSGSEKSQVL